MLYVDDDDTNEVEATELCEGRRSPQLDLSTFVQEARTLILPD